jgi:DNA-binding protein HU-beta
MASKPTAKMKKSDAPATAANNPAKPQAAKGAAAAAGQTKTTATITLKTIFEEMAGTYDLPRKQASALLAGMVEAVTMHLKNGDRIRMSGLGILEVRQRNARTGRNPATGQPIQLAASKKVAFRPAKELKALI